MLSEYGYVYTDKPTTTTWDSTEYKIKHVNSGDGTLSADSSQATITYLCEYNHFERFLDTVLGKTTVVSGVLHRSTTTGTFGVGEASLPEPHPYLENFYASSASFKGIGKSRYDEFVGSVWDKAEISVVFKPLNYNVIDDEAEVEEQRRFTTIETQATAEMLTSQALGYKWVTPSTHNLLSSQPGFMVGSTHKIYTWHQIPVIKRGGYLDFSDIPNASTVRDLLGTVNIVPFDNNQPGTCLFISYKPTLRLPQTAFGDGYYWDIQYTIGIRDYGASSLEAGFNKGWNYFFDPLQQAWDLVTCGTNAGLVTGKTVYDYNDLNDLFAITW